MGGLGDVYAGYVRERGAKRPPRRPFMPAPPIAERSASADELARLSREADVALLTIGRNSGEFVDRKRENDFELSEAEKVRGIVVVYLNRLSDALFMAARTINASSKIPDIPWIPGPGKDTPGKNKLTGGKNK